MPETETEPLKAFKDKDTLVNRVLGTRNHHLRKVGAMLETSTIGSDGLVDPEYWDKPENQDKKFGDVNVDVDGNNVNVKQFAQVNLQKFVDHVLRGGGEVGYDSPDLKDLADGVLFEAMYGFGPDGVDNYFDTNRANLSADGMMHNFSRQLDNAGQNFRNRVADDLEDNKETKVAVLEEAGYDIEKVKAKVGGDAEFDKRLDKLNKEGMQAILRALKNPQVPNEEVHKYVRSQYDIPHTN